MAEGPDRIGLEAPLDSSSGPLVRLMVSGVAERAGLGFEAMDDLQLAIERLLAEGGSAGRVTMSFELVPGRLRTRIGPLRARGLAEALQEPSEAAGPLTLSGILDAVVDAYGVEAAKDGDIVVRLEKLMEDAP